MQSEQANIDPASAYLDKLASIIEQEFSGFSVAPPDRESALRLAFFIVLASPFREAEIALLRACLESGQPGGEALAQSWALYGSRLMNSGLLPMILDLGLNRQPEKQVACKAILLAAEKGLLHRVRSELAGSGLLVEDFMSRGEVAGVFRPGYASLWEYLLENSDSSQAPPLKMHSRFDERPLDALDDAIDGLHPLARWVWNRSEPRRKAKAIHHLLDMIESQRSELGLDQGDQIALAFALLAGVHEAVDPDLTADSEWAETMRALGGEGLYLESWLSDGGRLLVLEDPKSAYRLIETLLGQASAALASTAGRHRNLTPNQVVSGLPDIWFDPEKTSSYARLALAQRYWQQAGMTDLVPEGSPSLSELLAQAADALFSIQPEAQFAAVDTLFKPEVDPLAACLALVHFTYLPLHAFWLTAGDEAAALASPAEASPPDRKYRLSGEHAFAVVLVDLERGDQPAEIAEKVLEISAQASEDGHRLEQVILQVTGEMMDDSEGAAAEAFADEVRLILGQAGQSPQLVPLAVPGPGSLP